MSINKSYDDFFVAGGTLAPDSASYVTRSPDDELLQLAQVGTFCYVLTPRQMGKSSLMIRTAHHLKGLGVKTAILDLTRIGTVPVDQWYLGLLTQLKRRLRLKSDPIAWWQARAALGHVQRFTDFLRDVILSELEDQIVIFIDEIDTTLNLPFSDDFFAALRAMYNARAEEPEFNRLTFILLGVATPSDLIKDHTRTPFNIGRGMVLPEFTLDEASVLQEGLDAIYPSQGKAILARIYHWTNGHPYLTQRLCFNIAKSGQSRLGNQQIDDLVEEVFFNNDAGQEINLQFVRDRVLNSPQKQQLLTLYEKVLKGQAVTDDGQSLIHDQLKLSGLVKAENGYLRSRNRIYRRAFDLSWVKEHNPSNWPGIFSTFARLWSS